MRVLLTGATGFLGWHTRVRLRAMTGHDVVVATTGTWRNLAQLVEGVDAVIHIAGVNRGDPAEVEHGNVALAAAVADAVLASGSSPRIVYANSIHAGSDSAYGVGKATAGALLASASARAGGSYVDVRLPNLFGEHGRPRYNSFVATFVEAVIAGSVPEIQDRAVSLLHVQGAAQSLIDALTTREATLAPAGTETSVRAVYDTLQTFFELYAGGDIPSLTSPFQVSLFNTLRAALFPHHYPIALTVYGDDRGSLAETVRVHGGAGQTFVSTTHPGDHQREHFHLSKVERFAVLSGRGRISLRRVFHDEVVSFDVNGLMPVVVDMPTMWVHNITNTGDDELVTMFWTNTLFDAAHPDTFWGACGTTSGNVPMTKVLTIVGTRPEIIRLSRVMARLDSTVDHILVHTGQNYDYELNEIFFDELGLRMPDHLLGVDTSSLGRTLGEILIKTEEVLRLERPDAVLILGDTNSSISAVMAKRMRIPVYHMEAGNRCFDENVPEETNRRLVDHVADFNLVYTEHARRNLLAEGLHPRRILLTGSPMKEVLLRHRLQFDQSTAVEDLGLTSGEYLLVSAHREENVDSPVRLNQLLDCLETARTRFGFPVVVSTHPRTRKRLDALERPLPEGVSFHDPLGFVDYIRLQQHAFCVLSDSGTISEESAILGFPAVTLRDSIERPEALDTGAIIMAGLDPASLVEAVCAVVAETRGSQVIPSDYTIENCSQRAVNFILSTHARHHDWAGIRA